MIFAVLDTNVIVSDLLSRNPDAATVKVLEATINGDICPLFSQEIMEEYCEVLCRPKFRMPIERIESIIERIQELGLKTERVQSTEIFPDLDDVVFYEVALSKEDAYLVTGNTKHFPKSPIVVTPSEMLQNILAQGE